MLDLGPNHKDDCTGLDWTYSGEGYNRVRLCACGAEDHDPDLTRGHMSDLVKWYLMKFGGSDA